MNRPTIAVIGGGLRGIAAARAAAKAGCRTYLIEPRQFLGHELTAAGHSWLKSGDTEITVQIGAARKQMLASQLEYGVQPLLASHAGAIATADGKACGVLIANSYGTELLAADAVIDTEGTLFAAPYEGVRQAAVHYAFTLTGVEPPFFRETKVDPAVGLCDNSIILHPDARPGCISVEFAFRAEVTHAVRIAPQRLLPEAQRRAEKILDHLRASYPVFANAGLHKFMFHEVWLHETEPYAQQALPQDYHVLAQPLSRPLSTGTLEAMSEEIGQRVQAICAAVSPKGEPDTLRLSHGSIPMHDCRIGDFAGGGSLGLRSLTFPFDCIPCRERTGVVVAGGGTAGEQVMRALVEKEIPFAVVEANALMGGTRIVGLVAGYWHGYTGGLNAALDREARARSAKYAARPSAHDGSANILLQNAFVASAEEHFYMLSFVCGASVSDGRVKALLCCDAGGLFSLEADVFIDASGDGAAAVFAGAEYACGDARDGSTQSFSQWGESVKAPSSFLHDPNKGDYDIVDVESYADMLRCMILSQRHISSSDYSPMLTVRESRRIVGDYVLTMEDIWNETAFEDTLAVTETPFDTHGMGSSAFCNMGLMKNIDESALRARIPYRSYLVRGCSNMLITAKAFSATRDASSVCRMNPDLRHAGYAVGLAAAQAVRRGCDLRAIDIKAVQAELLEKECLPAWTFESLPHSSTEETIEDAINGSSNALRKLYLAKDEARKAIIDRWYAAPQDETLLPLAAWHGEEKALRILAERTGSMIAEPYTGKSPEYRHICRHIAAMAHAEQTSPAMLLPVIEHAWAGGAAAYCYNNARYENTIYGFNRVDCWKLPCHDLLHLAALAVERHADPSLAGPMEQLLGRENIHGYLTRGGAAPKAPVTCHGLAPAFCSFLELRLTAAAARCTSRAALLRLTDFVGEDRSLLRRFAVQELMAITGQSFGENAQAWRCWLEENRVESAVPYTGEMILV